MHGPIAYLNGRFLPAAEAQVALDDVGFVHGATVVERLRTFQGRLFRLPEHLARLRRSLEIVGVENVPTDGELSLAAEKVTHENSRLLANGDELGLVIFVTPGRLGWNGDTPAAGPTVCVHSQRLPIERWAQHYEAGAALVSVPVVQPPPESWPAELKCRSRMHFYLAEREAAKIELGAMALLCDAAGHVTECTIANVAVSIDGATLISPPKKRILPGITLAATQELAAAREIGWIERDLTIAEMGVAQEIWLTSTPWCVLPVTRFNGRAVGAGRPGALYRQMARAWNDLVGCDFAAQARRSLP